MKRILSATLAGLMLATAAGSAASARGYGGGWHDRGGYGWHDHRGNGGALLGAGLGLFALGALLASRHDDRYDDRYYAPPPPPPAYGYDRYDDGYYGR